MSDPFAARLAALAPDVDAAASRELFESLRSEDGSRDQPGSRNPRWWLAAACVLLLVAGAVGVWAVAGRDDGGAPATPPADSALPRGDGTEFRLVAMEPVGDFDRRSISTARTGDELQGLLAGYRDSFDRYADDVTFQGSAEVAVVIEAPDNACPRQIERFIPAEGTWRVEWAEKSPEPCEDIGLGWVYLVAIPRNALTGIDTVVLPAEDLGGRSVSELTAPVPGTAEPVPDTAEPPRADGTEFRVIAMEPVGRPDRPGIQVAGTRDELDEVLGGYRDSLDRYAAEVEFDQSAEVAVVIERLNSGCPLEIERFVPNEFDSTWRVEWADPPAQDCLAIDLGWVYLVAIPRSALTGIHQIVVHAGRAAQGSNPALTSATLPSD